MKKQLLFEFTQFLFRKMSFGIAAFTVLTLLTVQSSFAQTWNILGNENQISAVSSSYTSIAVLNDVPYVVFRENSTVPVVIVKKRNATTGLWEQVGDNIGSNLTYTKIYLDKVNNLWVTYVDAANGNKLAVKMYNSTTNVWEALKDSNNVDQLYVSTGTVTYSVSQLNSNPRSSLAFDSDNVPYIAFGEGTALTPTVKKFDGATWVALTGTINNPTGAALGVSLVIDEADVPWLVYCSSGSNTSTTGIMALYQYKNGSWASSTASPVTGGIRHTSMALNSAGNLVIVYFDATATTGGNRATAIEYSKNAVSPSWSTVTRLGTKDSPYLSLIRDVSGSLYCSFIDAVTSPTWTSAPRVFMQAAGATAWAEMKDPTVSNGIDTGASSLAVAAGSVYPYVVYTKTNSSSISTPIVRLYAPAPPPAVLTTNNLTNISTTTAVSGGNITSDGGAAITERGVVYSNSNASPTTANSKVADATGGMGNFSVTLSGLSPGTFYYTRAYATNSGGTTYGNTVRLSTLQVPDAVVTTPKQVEFLSRGLVAMKKSSSSIYLSWRLLGDDPESIAFNVYRNGVKVNSSPITTSTNYLDNTTLQNNTYSITTIINGVESQQITPVTLLPLNTFNTSGRNNHLSIPLQMPPGGTLPDGRTYTYTANDASVGDVDGDGTYEVILKWDPTIVNDNAGGYSGKQIFDCYKLDGTRVWRIDLGININSGPHYNQFMVYDFDGDGKAEMILKTADGTIDGTGVVIGNSTVDYRNTSGWVQQGPEFLTVFNGLTGAAMSTVTYQPSRDNVSDWGDNYGNRQDRFVSAVAYLDGARPSMIVGRGYYNRLTRAAYNWRNGQLTMLWKFDSKDPTHPEYNAYSGQGNHQMTIGDVDGDGKDEIINGSSVINDDGKPLWTYRLGHGDALHMTDMELDRPGQEIWINLESPGDYDGMGLRQYDAKTGQTNWGIATTGDVGRSMAADIDPYYKGYEMWGSSGGNVYDAKGNSISTSVPSYNFGIWWDGDLGRELADKNIIDKWNPTTKSAGRLFTIYNDYPVTSNNSSKSTPCLQADILGDWREETILRKSDNTELVIFTTDTPTTYRIPTLMHDPQYRVAVAWQNSAYNQPPNPSYYIGYDMAINPVTGNVVTPTPNIYVAKTGGLGLSPTNGVTSSALKAYPNPTSGLFSLQLDSVESGKATVKIVALNGQIVKQRDVLLTGVSQTVLFDISAEAAGVYLIKVTTKEGVTTQKIILQK
jgi:hypothetical protein